MATRSSGTTRKSTSRRASRTTTDTTAAATVEAGARTSTPSARTTSRRAASRAETVAATTREAAERTRRARPLAEREAEAMAKGYVGVDASDTDLTATRPGIRSGVGKEQGAPGGHPSDPTSKESVGAAR